VKGTRDILPPESALWNRVEQTARRVFATYGFGEIRLPVFEQTELFARSVGVDTDIISKEMYSFEDRDGSSISLRPEATASVARAYIEHGMKTRPGLVRLFYIGPMFRRERPQKGRYRQFYQIGAEVMGQSDHPAIDAEVIEMLLEFISQCGLKEWKLAVNAIGCPECRPGYVEKLRTELQKVKDKLGPDSQRRIETNPLRVLDSKVEGEQEVIAGLPSILDSLCEACREHFGVVKEELEARGIKFEINWRLVRGLDYYMRTTFEVTAPGLGSQDAICGGGRYDGLVEMVGGPPTKGMGFALGTDRLILALRASGQERAPDTFRVFVVWMGDKGRIAARNITRKLRAAGVDTEMLHEERKLRKAMDQAAKSGARYAVIIGEEEVAQKMFILRDLNVSKQEALSEEELLKVVSRAQ
jgi:histidyl-tRNA synthetase